MSKSVWIALMAVLTLPGACSATSIAYSKVRVGKVAAHVVTVDLNDAQVRVTVALAKGGAGKQESFKSMMRRTKPVAAITGTFFDTRTLIPTGDIALYGTVVHSGCIGSALCIDSNNKACIVSLREGRQTHWAGYETVLCAGPRLVSDGKVAISLRKEGFHTSLCAPARRTAVGISKTGKLLVVAINRNASLHDIARVLVELGARDGLCLDGGSSTAFYHDGSFLAVPSRQLTNCLVVYSGESAYQAAKTDLAPADCFAKATTDPFPRRADATASLFNLSAMITPEIDTQAVIRAARN